MLKIVVVAGNHHQAVDWCRHAALDVHDPQVKIIDQGGATRRLMGIRITEEDRVVFVGDCWRRRDFHDIWEELVRRGWNQRYERGET